ncbi:GNAT family N-acetyltransferase [Lacticaseibacillus chiayiensis]|uniref:GNAT family N-acetyltransferase n=1 Tax=Lacticaseibacillus chiayiensis TaxID=2100821 RepID=A0A4Q1TKA3_9LACO|nr:GNAT family N-acetyltransferase [Lacticaseibacillus chiayiensis]QVI34662.1 GNAT family N-acetyltransferase [Lacticaseibacillus chiayiensis]RXT18884.1 GNAT family N-acetyltransferase [Lacticaseibacillus chiayiensis]UYN56411.1 GNAT family N-acetyltransferase [Lacticaseibacillus chiayiensis]
MADIRIVKATPDTDFDAVSRVYYETWQFAYRHLLPESFLKQLTQDSWHPERRWKNTFLAMNGTTKIVGVCSFGPARMADYEGWGELYSLYVLPHFQRQRIGGQLIGQALKQLKRNYARQYVRVLNNNLAAQRFYQQFGFKKTELVLEDVTRFGTIRELMMIREGTG